MLLLLKNIRIFNYKVEQVNVHRWKIDGYFENYKVHIYRGPWQLSRYSDWLRAGRSEDRTPGRGEIFRTRPDPSSLLYNGYQIFTGVKRPERGAGYLPPSSAEVKKE
jgi:hypothetical protein